MSDTAIVEVPRWSEVLAASEDVLDAALAERRAYRLDAALALYDAVAVALPAVTAAAELQLSDQPTAAPEADDAEALDALVAALLRSDSNPGRRGTAISSAAEGLKARADTMRSEGRAFVQSELTPSELSARLKVQRRQAAIGGAESLRLQMRPAEACRRLETLASPREPRQPGHRGERESVAMQELLLELCCGDGGEGSGEGRVEVLLASVKAMGRLGPPTWALRHMGRGWERAEEARTEADEEEAMAAELGEPPRRYRRLARAALQQVGEGQPPQLLLDMAVASLRAGRPADAARCLARAVELEAEWRAPCCARLAQAALTFRPGDEVAALLWARGEWLDAAGRPVEAAFCPA